MSTRNGSLSILVVLTHMLFLACAYSQILEGQNKLIQGALQYAQLPPMERSRDKAAELILAALKTSSDSTLRGELYLQLARLYSQNFNPNTEKPELTKAIDAYNSAISSFWEKPEIKAISSKIELCGVLTRVGRDVDVLPILQNIIKLRPDAVYAAELNPEFLARLSVLDPREKAAGVTIESETHKGIVEDRIRRAKQNILESFESKRESAIRTFCNVIYRRDGLSGLKKQVDLFSGDPMGERISKEVLFDYIKSS